MKSNFMNESWRALLPEVHGWLDRVQIVAEGAAQGKAHHVVGVDGDGDQGDSVKLNASGLDAAFAKKISDTVKALGIKNPGKSQPTLLLVGETPVLLVALTKNRVTTAQKARQYGLDMAKGLKDLKADQVVVGVPDGFDPVSICDGMALGFYEASSFKGHVGKIEEKTPKLPSKVSFLGQEGKLAGSAISNFREYAKAIAFTRMLQDAPANWLNPVRWGDIAAEACKDAGLKCSVLDKAGIAAKGMGAFVSVSNGSDIEPRLITIEIDGKDNSKCVTLVGKGLTFDSGGISIKPSAAMDEMKYDMSGGAAVLGAALYLGKVKPPVKVVAVIGCTENMPSGKATKPGDVVVAMNGKTVEVNNTDAEGRLVLADLLHYAATSFNPDLMIDVATLTGAVLYALGHVGAAYMTNHERAASYFEKVAEASGEPFWRLPLWSEFEKEIKGETGDLSNIAKPNVHAGTIMGATFLKEFVSDKQWIHLDVAGTAWACKATGYPGSGGSAFSLRAMVEACLRFPG